MSDLIADFLVREQEQLGDDFSFDEINNDTLNNHTLDLNDDFENFPESNDFGTTDIMQENDTYQSSYTANKTEYSLPKIEPEKIRVWRTEFENRIQKKDEDELQRIANLEKEAKKELEDWNANHSEQLTNKRKFNRESQGAFVKERDQPLPGSEWQRVCKMCEFSTRSAVTVKPMTPNGENVPALVPKDTSRMKSILLSLKTDPLVRA